MKKLIKTILVVFIFFLLSSCSNTRNIEHKLYDLDSNNDLSGSNEIIMSYETYSNFILEHEIKEEYTLDYFENEFLVVAYLPTTYNSDIKFNNFLINNKNLILDFVTSESSLDYDSTKLFLIEFDNSYLEKFNNIQINLNNQDITNNNERPNFYVKDQNALYLYYDGYAKIINNEEDYLYFIKQLQNQLPKNSKYNQEYFHLNSLVYFYVNTKCNEDEFSVSIGTEGNSLLLNVDSLETNSFEHGYLCIVEVDNKYINETNNIKVVLNEVEVINNYDVLTYRDYNYSGIIDLSSYSKPVVVSDWSELIKNSLFGRFFDYYRNYDFENKSLILLGFRIDTKYFVTEIVKVVENDTLTIGLRPAICSGQDWLYSKLVVIEIDSRDLENINTITKQYIRD